MNVAMWIFFKITMTTFTPSVYEFANCLKQCKGRSILKIRTSAWLIFKWIAEKSTKTEESDYSGIHSIEKLIQVILPTSAFLGNTWWNSFLLWL